MEIKGTFSFDCQRCGKSYNFSKEEINFVEVEGTENDKHYVWDYKFNCLKCGNPISIKYDVFISPDGKITDKKVDIKGAKVTNDSLEFAN